MNIINEHEYLEKLKACTPDVKDFISNIYLNTSFLIFLNKYHKIKSKEEESDTTDLLRSTTVHLLLQIITVDQFIDTIFESLDVQPDEADALVEDFFKMCVPPNIYNFKDTQPESPETDHNTESKIQEAKLAEKTESNQISHFDILNEIENPTPSIKSSTFTSSVTSASGTTGTVNPPNNTNTLTPASIQNNTGITPKASLHSSDPSIIAYTNPAQNIANKLQQSFDTPSVSIPKDIYVSKKPDPYHEPVE